MVVSHVAKKNSPHDDWLPEPFTHRNRLTFHNSNCFLILAAQLHAGLLLISKPKSIAVSIYVRTYVHTLGNSEIILWCSSSGFWHPLISPLLRQAG